MYGTPRVLQSIAKESVIPGIDVLGKGVSFDVLLKQTFINFACLQRGPNKVPLYAMVVVAIVTVSFIIVGNINFLAPIVTMPFLLTYACIDYSYFALAQTFDIQEQREERFRIQASSPSYETRLYGSTQDASNDLDLLFPDRVRHKNLQSPQNSPQHVPYTNNVAAATSNQPQTDLNHYKAAAAAAAVIRDGGVNSTNNADGDLEGVVTASGDAIQDDNEEEEPIAPIRPPIHSKTKNWYSGFCNRWASLLGVSKNNYIPSNLVFKLA